MSVSFIVLKFKLKALDRVLLPPFPAITLRGGLGATLKKVYCVHRRLSSECKECILKNKCSYAYLFETYSDKDVSVVPFSGETVPHPFVLYMKSSNDVIRLEEGGHFDFEMVLIGRAIEFLPYVIYGVEFFGDSGIGLNKSRFSLERVVDDMGTEIYGTDKQFKKVYHVHHWSPTDGEDVEMLKVKFVTPLRVKRDGKLTDNIDFGTLVRGIIRRAVNLAYFHCDSMLEEGFSELSRTADSVSLVHGDTRWVEFQRYSGRQKEILSLGGVVGELTFRNVPGVFMPYLELGERIHVGKNTGFGFGKIKVEKVGMKDG